MSRISAQVLARAVDAVQAMDLTKKEVLADEIFRVQPCMLASVMAQKEFGVALEKINFLLHVLLVCFQAMNESGLTWATVTEVEQERQLQRYLAIFESSGGNNDPLRDELLQQYINSHPEKWLLAYVSSETAAWLKRTAPAESDKYVMLAALNLVNCIAFSTLAEV
jgi:hypothetical protein